MDEPKRTLELLNILRGYGFDNSHFKQLHPRKGSNITIEKHIEYIEDNDISYFIQGASPDVFYTRLELL